MRIWEKIESCGNLLVISIKMFLLRIKLEVLLRKPKTCSSLKKMGEKTTLVPETETDPNVVLLVSEGLAVIRDMLEVGSAASLFSDIVYDGFILVVEDFRPPFGNNSIDYGFYIKMCSVSNLAKCLHKYPRMQEKNWELVYTLKRFAEKYADYYDPAEEAYIYCTTNSVSVPKKLKKGQQPLNLLGTLYDEVRKHCPLADFEGTPIHTKNVYH